MTWVDGITDSTDMSLSKPCVIVKDREVWRAAVRGVAQSQTRSSGQASKHRLSEECFKNKRNREGRVGMRDTCTPMADSHQCMAKKHHHVVK